MRTIVDFYNCLRDDVRLQKDWELNQPRIDRGLESVLNVRVTREVATAVLLACKLRFEPAAKPFLDVSADKELLNYGSLQAGAGGSRLVKLIMGSSGGVDPVCAGAVWSLMFYRCRSDARNVLMRLPWSTTGLANLSRASTDEIISPALPLVNGDLKAKGMRELAVFLATPSLLDDRSLRSRLLSIPGLGPERADAVGVFDCQMPWPIVDEYLWRLLGWHGLLAPEVVAVKGYEKRRKVFQAYWDQLVSANLAESNELAATLYLWADEAERFGYTYQ